MRLLDAGELEGFGIVCRAKQGLNVQVFLDLLEVAAVRIDHGDIVLLLLQQLGQMPSNRAGAGDNDMHNPILPT